MLEKSMLEDLPGISVVFVTYDRIETLEPTVISFLDGTDYPREKLQIIVADDGSKPEIQEQIKKLPIDQFVTGARRSGLSANVNRGLAAAQHEFVLQMQDDWLCDGPPDYLRRSIELLRKRTDLGMVILNNHPNKLELRETLKIEGELIRIHQNDPNSEVRLVGQHAYTDWPHLKSRRFINKIGPYNERLAMWDAELDYSRRVNSQLAFFISEIDGLNAFRHIGESLSFNTGSLRARSMRQLRRIPLVSPVLDFLKRNLVEKNK